MYLFWAVLISNNEAWHRFSGVSQWLPKIQVHSLRICEFMSALIRVRTYVNMQINRVTRDYVNTRPICAWPSYNPCTRRRAGTVAIPNDVLPCNRRMVDRKFYCLVQLLLLYIVKQYQPLVIYMVVVQHKFLYN